jgi:hypothetical protein
MLEPTASEAFEPSKDVKSYWLYTRKSSYNAAGIELPGLFNTHNFQKDAAAFVAVVFLELWGLYNLLAAIGSISSYAMGGVVAVFLLDIGLAFVRHLPSAVECRSKNSLILSFSPEDRFAIEQKRRKLKWLSPLGSLLILALAGLKTYLFYMLNEEITGQTASVLVSYLIAAILHITNTGYFIWGLIFSFFLKRERNKWASRDAIAKEKLSIHRKREYRIDLVENESIDFKEARSNDHEIRSFNENGKQGFLLATSGVLTDAQLQGLVNSQPSPNAKRMVALKCLEAQLDILDSDPIPPGQ